MTARVLGAAYLLVLAALCVAQPCISGCSITLTPAEHPDPTCTDQAYEEQEAKCHAAAALCVAQGGIAAECDTVCDHVADEWGKRCQ